MSEVVPARERAVPRWVPASLAFVAGYVDIYTFLGLFGLFVANVTGSFITAGAELVTHDVGIVGKVIAVALLHPRGGVDGGTDRTGARTRLGAVAVDARFRGVAAGDVCRPYACRPAGRAAPATGRRWSRVCLAAAAMGAQSVIVRLLMKGIPQTNVMTGNMTQLGIEMTELLLAWRRQVRAPHDPEHARNFAAARSRLFTVLAIATGFLLGAVSGAAQLCHGRGWPAPLSPS